MISWRSARRFVVRVAERVAGSSPTSPIAVPPLTPLIVGIFKSGDHGLFGADLFGQFLLS
jgi:hypothetical protein